MVRVWGFILVSAGCAIGIGNVWKFPYMCGEFGGAAFILIYLLFLVILGIPVLVCEFAVGRGSRHSVAARLRGIGAGRNPLAYDKVDRSDRKLSADDVLYHCRRMDDVLLSTGAYGGEFVRRYYGRSYGRIFEYAGQCAGDDFLDGTHMHNWICGMPVWNLVESANAKESTWLGWRVHECAVFPM